MRASQYRTLLDGRTDTMWNRYRHSDTLDLLHALRRNQQAGRYLIAGDIAAIRAQLERGQTLNDLGKPTLRRILDERFEYVAAENREGRA
jgi:hypothetical protein